PNPIDAWPRSEVQRRYRGNQDDVCWQACSSERKPAFLKNASLPPRPSVQMPWKREADQPKQQKSWRQRQQRQIRLHSRGIECIAKRFAASKVSTQPIDDDQKDAGGQQPVADRLDDTAHATTRTLHTPRVPRTNCP